MNIDLIPGDPMQPPFVIRGGLARPRRRRQPSLATILRQARKAGADRVEYGRAVIYLGSDGATPAEPANPWDSVLPDKGDAHGPH